MSGDNEVVMRVARAISDADVWSNGDYRILALAALGEIALVMEEAGVNNRTMKKIQDWDRAQS